jgi:hypothetical protein
MKWIVALSLVGVICLVTACDRPVARAAEKVGVVDSFLPRDEALRKFRVGLTPVTELGGGSDSRDQLVANFVKALGAQDTAALGGMIVTRSEFGYLYYPTTPEAYPPYDLEPGLMWHLRFEGSERGIRRALRTYGGQKIRLLGYDCGSQPSREGKNTVWGPCILTLRTQAGDTRQVRLFSQIIEREGRYKFLSYANKL